MQFYLADVEAFTSPLVVIPDMGGNAQSRIALPLNAKLLLLLLPLKLLT